MEDIDKFIAATRIHGKMNIRCIHKLFHYQILGESSVIIVQFYCNMDRTREKDFDRFGELVPGPRGSVRGFREIAFVSISILSEMGL